MATETPVAILTRLREGTALAHRQLEGHSLLQPLQSPVLNIDQYTRIIAAFSGYFDALESHLEWRLDTLEGEGYRYLPRSPLLAEDRKFLPTYPVTACRAVPEPRCRDELMGVLYVIEGATQGGRVIAPLLARVLSLGEGPGTRYFHLHRYESWRRFCVMMAAHNRCGNPALAVDMARNTFHTLYQHLDDCLLTQ